MIVIATNSFDTNFVAIILPAVTASAKGTPIKIANGENTYPRISWNEIPNITFK